MVSFGSRRWGAAGVVLEAEQQVTADALVCKQMQQKQFQQWVFFHETPFD